MRLNLLRALLFLCLIVVQILTENINWTLHERILGFLWYEGIELGGIKLQRSRQFFSSLGSLRPFKGSPNSRTSRGPLAHTFIRQNKSFSEVKNLATGQLIICQKEEIPVIFRKNRHALLTCGTEVT